MAIKTAIFFSVVFIFWGTCTSNVEQIQFMKNQFSTVKQVITPHVSFRYFSLGEMYWEIVIYTAKSFCAS